MASVPRFQLSFGDFSEEEHNNYLDRDSSCVEFALSPCANEGDASKDSENGQFPKLQTYKLYSNGLTAEEENHNAVASRLQSTCFDHVELPPVTGDGNNALPQPICTLPNHKVNGLMSETVLKPNFDSNSVEEDKLVAHSVAVEPETEGTADLINGHLTDADESTTGVENPAINGKTNTEIEGVHENDISTQKDLLSESYSKLVPNSVSSPPPTKGKLQVASWASLFSGTTQNHKQTKPAVIPSVPKPAQQAQTTLKDSVQQKKKQTGIQNGLPNTKQPSKTEVVEVDKDLFSKQIAEQIAKNEIVYRSPGLMPRGFINSSNWCYVNATLQALLTSSPFCHLMRSLPSRQACADTNIISTSTPILDSFVRLVKELKPLPKKTFQRNSKDQFHGTPYQPEYIYKMLSTIESKFSERGRQEDAEEFLSCVLNGLHEEMLRLTEFYFEKDPSTANQDESVVNNSQMELGYEVPVHDEDTADDSNEDEDQWEEVTATRKNRSSVMRRADISKTPVSDVFRGELRSDLFQEGQRGTATLEPFFTLPLDINEQKRWSVAEALEHLTRLENVQDFTNSKTKAKVEATRRLTLETLPPVLILHLKRFVYDKEGGSLKIDKEVQYHTDLLIGKELLSKSSKKISQDKRTYKLFAVVYHHGKAATGGHYTTDVYHDGLNCWLRIDDQHIKNTSVHEVVRHNPERTAYLLYYKRTDLMAV